LKKFSKLISYLISPSLGRLLPN